MRRHNTVCQQDADRVANREYRARTSNGAFGALLIRLISRGTIVSQQEETKLARHFAGFRGLDLINLAITTNS
jgi:hypothetical protein